MYKPVRRLATRNNVIVCYVKVVDISVEVVPFARFGYVDQVVWNAVAIDGVIGEVFTRADVHTAINLSAVGTDYLTAYLLSQTHSIARLAGCRRTEYSYEHRLR